MNIPQRRIWSHEQKQFFTWFASGTGNLIGEAYAGTGKTTTIKECFGHAPEQRMLYAVFNKRAQKEAEEKITDSRVDVKTLHSLGFAFVKSVWSTAKPDPDVDFDRADMACRELNLYPEQAPFVAKLLGFLKNTSINPTAEEAMDTLYQYNLASGNQKVDTGIVQAALSALSASRNRDAQGRISFDDMVWLPIAMNWVKPRYQLVVVDEAQDMNLPQLMMAKQASSGRVVVVGDRRQAIYGFRGAATGGMEMMRDTLKASVLKLTTTYRCPKAVVQEAQSVVPEYKAADCAPDGTVSTVAVEQALQSVRPGDAVLSRLNAPLMPLALKLIRANVSARIEGRDIGKQVSSLARSMKANDVPDFVAKVETWLNKQTERLSKSKNAEKKIEQAQDLAETLKAVALDCDTVDGIVRKIDNLFDDTTTQSKPAVVLSSVHKAKGLEWPNVYILRETFRRGKDEEDNIYYVAVTRAMKTLTFIGSDVARAQVKVVMAQAPALPATPLSRGKSLAQFAHEADAALRKAQTFDEIKVVPGNRLFKRGDIIALRGSEMVCLTVNACNAKFRPVTGEVKTVTNKLTGESATFTKRPEPIAIANSYHLQDSIAPARCLSESELEELLTRKTTRRSVKSEGDQTNETESTDMTNKNKKATIPKRKSAAKVTGGLTGSAQYMRQMVTDGKSKPQAFEAMLEKWPQFEKDKVGLESRWNMAVKIVKPSSSKPGAKPSVKPGAKVKTPARKPVKNKSTPIPARSSAIPPRPAPAAPTTPQPESATPVPAAV